MKFTAATAALVNKLRREIQRKTVTIDDGESVSILLWWTFINDHARHMGKEPKQLAREQLEHFLDAADRLITIRREH